MDVVQFTAPVRPEAIIASEYDANYCREAGVMNAGQAALLHAVVGQTGVGAVTAVAKAGGNTGNGTLTLDPATPALANALIGTYRVVFTAANAFNVFDPKGDELGQGQNGAAFADQIKFTTAAGGTAFVAGDEFDVTIAVGAGGYSPLAAAAVDGTQNAAGVTLSASDSDGNVTVLRRGPAILRQDMLQWPAGYTATQIAAGIAQLAALGIVCRVTG